MSARDVVKGFLDQLAGGDAAAIVAMFTDDAVIDMPGGDDLPWAGRWQGKAAIEDYFRVMPGGARHARACHQDLGRRGRHRFRQRRGGWFVEDQRQALPREVVLGLPPCATAGSPSGTLTRIPRRSPPAAPGVSRFGRHGRHEGRRRRNRECGRHRRGAYPVGGRRGRDPRGRRRRLRRRQGAADDRADFGRVCARQGRCRLARLHLLRVRRRLRRVDRDGRGARRRPRAPAHRRSRSRAERCRRRVRHQRCHAARGARLRRHQLRRHRGRRAQDHLRRDAARGAGTSRSASGAATCRAEWRSPWWWRHSSPSRWAGAASGGSAPGQRWSRRCSRRSGTTRRRWPEQPSRDAHAGFDWAGVGRDAAGRRLVALWRGVPALHRSMVRGRHLAADIPDRDARPRAHRRCALLGAGGGHERHRQPDRRLAAAPARAALCAGRARRTSSWPSPAC